VPDTLVAAHVRPVYKWAGGKAWIVPSVSPGIFARLGETGGRYFEPFLGGGALALDLGLPGMVLGDVCEPLVAAYEAIRTNAKAVAWALQTLVGKGIDESAFYAVRASTPSSPAVAAARFIYLNRLTYNGLWRVNRSGQFNAPYGDAVKRAKDVTAIFPKLERLQAVAAALATAELRVSDFRDVVPEAGQGDVVFADPPYIGSFSAYSEGGFTEEDHVQLAKLLHEAADRGAAIIATNSDTPLIRGLYSWAKAIPTQEARAIGQKASSRVRAACLCLTNTPELVAP
jgi:DNA adenine methylase